jgi:thiosulfate/3-mercaptopyruvate sulfurtransferase
VTSQPLVLLLVLLAPAQERANSYPRADLLLEPAELARPEVAKRFRVLDARPKKQYAAGHIPGAVWVDHNAWSRAFARGQEPRDWAARIGKLGIGDKTRVVVYGEPVNDAARIWWILHYWGVKDNRLLNGGWKAWQAAGYPVSTAAPQVAAGRFTAGHTANSALATREQLLEALKRRPPQIVDARSQDEYCGTVELAKRGGSIPGAINLDWTDLLEPKTKRFKSPAELRTLFKQAGIKLDRPTVTYCQSGGRAAAMAFGLELMGARDVANYYLSWSEWGNAADTPVARPPAKRPQ